MRHILFSATKSYMGLIAAVLAHEGKVSGIVNFSNTSISRFDLTLYLHAKTIVQASDLKQKLDKLSINKSNNTIASFDAVAMYPSVKFEMVERAVEYFIRNASESD